LGSQHEYNQPAILTFVNPHRPSAQPCLCKRAQAANVSLREEQHNGAIRFAVNRNRPSPGPGSSQSTLLTVGDVQNVIARARATDPVTVGMQIFNNLDDSITVDRDTLRQALAASSVNVAGPLSALVAAAQSDARSGSQVTLANTEQVQTEIGGTPVRFNQLVTFDVGTGSGFPTISNIQGAAAQKFIWVNITEIQLRQNQGHRILHVETSAGSQDFPLALGPVCSVVPKQNKVAARQRQMRGPY